MIVGKSVGGIKGYEKKVYIKNGWILGERVVGLRYVLQSSDEYI